MGWYSFKQWLEAASGLDMDALHIHAGLLVQLLAALLLRRSLSSLWPWLVVLAATLANEAYDLHFETWPEPDRARQLAEGVKDLLNTMLMPTILLLLARYAPRLIIGRAPVSRDSAELARREPFA